VVKILMIIIIDLFLNEYNKNNKRNFAVGSW
jgi:hypothetical protein